MARRIALLLLLGLSVASLAIVAGGAYGIYAYKSRQYAEIGSQNAVLGAKITQHVIDRAVGNGVFDVRTLFDDPYERIDDGEPARYRTGYDHYFSKHIQAIQDAFLEAEAIYYACVINNDGYVAIHTDPALSKLILATEKCPQADKGSSHVRAHRDADGNEYREYAASIVI